MSVWVCDWTQSEWIDHLCRLVKGIGIKIDSPPYAARVRAKEPPHRPSIKPSPHEVQAVTLVHHPVLAGELEWVCHRLGRGQWFAERQVTIEVLIVACRPRQTHRRADGAKVVVGLLTRRIDAAH